ncbi:YopX family protein [Mammaliicoccus sciuri]|uniref:YopX family protein n=1 Tax=Mammaliicoccus sciuri TaxID=1296 RepID=UPI002887BA86|nr:YopX family protein [Mammaliicoccus sciuri]MDT0707337.1 YopX family protein [Mammaliicoccus sciuri]
MIPKFKAYDLNEKEWIDIRYIELRDDGSLWYVQAWDECERDIDPPYFEEDLGKTWVLMQSTGLFDKNGKEIFEGDILKVFVLGDEGAIAKVIFKNGMFGIEDDMHGYGYDKGLYSLHQILSLRDAEIIGNRFEHPHLLGED